MALHMNALPDCRCRVDDCWHFVASQGVDFWAVNTDAQALENSLSSNKLQLGGELTRGLGARWCLSSHLRYVCGHADRALLGLG